MATLSNSPISIGDSVHDIIYGPGEVVAIDGSGNLTVTFGSAGRPRKYSQQGITGKLCYRTLFHRPPAIIEFPREECNAAKLACALDQVMGIFNDLTNCKCPEPKEPECPCEQPEGCAKWQ